MYGKFEVMFHSGKSLNPNVNVPRENYRHLEDSQLNYFIVSSNNLIL